MYSVGNSFAYFSYKKSRLDLFVECAFDNFELLFFRKSVEVYGISRNSYREHRVFFGMLVSVHKSFAIENVYVKMLSALRKISVEYAYKI